jgi:hypothetical protein
MQQQVQAKLIRKILNREEKDESGQRSRPIRSQPRLPPALRHKPLFAYEYFLDRAITRRCMHVHAVLSSFKANKLSTTEERMTRWLHRLDG